MKTFAQVRKKKTTNWNIALDTPVKDIDTWQKLSQLSGDWVTCACGNQCAIIPRGAKGMPENQTLRILGNDFYNAVRDTYFSAFFGRHVITFESNVKRAKKVLETIELVSAELIEIEIRKLL
jgi:hypothetical protein